MAAKLQFTPLFRYPRQTETVMAEARYVVSSSCGERKLLIGVIQRRRTEGRGSHRLFDARGRRVFVPA